MLAGPHGASSMTRNTESDTEARQLRTLLTLARELMQADTPAAALALAGRATAALTRFDGAVLLVRGEIDASIGFDLHCPRARPTAATPGVAWHGKSRRASRAR